MISVETTVLILLAAGKSERMGDVGSKLDQPFLSRPLGLHVAVALGDMPFRRRCAVVSDSCALDYAPLGFEMLTNSDPARDLSSSVRLGIECARGCDPAAVLIALADMPRVTATHIYRMLDAAHGDDAVVASSNGFHPTPPAIFGRAHFDTLASLTGDEGANRLIKAGRHVVTNAAELIDVDTPDELEQLRALVHAPEALSRPGTMRF